MKRYCIFGGISLLVWLIILSIIKPDWAFWLDREFWWSSFPSWLQGLGTVAGAYVGWRALTAWQDQDSGRRRADCAEAILTDFHRAFEAILDARAHIGIGEPEDALLLADPTGQNGKAITEAYLSIRQDMLKAKPHKFGLELRKLRMV